ncbi:MAG: hypothetical protein K8R91_01380 [Phycisphaerae bacterium]|nr:hypothetical protein [Phycisphaerae bacterium]
MAYPTRTLRELSRVIFSRLVGIILILVVVVAGALMVTYFGPWQYRSKAMLDVDPTNITISPLEAPTSIRDRLSLFILKQRDLIATEYVQASALMRLDNIASTSSDDKLKDLKGYQWYDDEQVAEFAAKNFDRLADVQKRIQVTTPGGVDVTQTFTVTVDWPEERGLSLDGEPNRRALATKRAQQFTKHLLAAYQFRRTFLEVKQATESSMVLMAQATDSARKNLETAQGALEEYIAKEIGGDILLIQSMLEGIGETGLHTLRTTFQAKINTIDARLAELTSLNEQIDQELKKGSDEQVVIPQVLLADNLALSKVIGSIADLRIRLNNLTPRFENSYKEIREVQAELSANLGDLKNELTRQRTMLNQEIAALGGQRVKLVEIVAEDQKQIAAMAGKAAKYDRLNKDADDAQKILSKRLEGYLNAESAEASAKAPLRVTVADGPSLPNVDRPHRPIWWANIIISIFAGVILSLVYAFLSDHFDHTVKSIDDVERHIETGVLASVPRFGHRIIRTNRGIQNGPD